MPHLGQAELRSMTTTGHMVEDGKQVRTEATTTTKRQPIKRDFVGDSLVSVTRPGYKTLSRSLSGEMPSVAFSPRGVAVNGTGTEGGVDETPSVPDREARIGLGGPLLPTGRIPGDAGLVKESNWRGPTCC